MNDITKLFSGLSISASGLNAERVRMGLIAHNLAHSSDTDRGDGTPYRRMEPVFSTVLEGALAGGVYVSEIQEDHRSPLVRIHRPGHPHADAAGMVSYPNVNPSVEMVDLITASRAYQANLQASRTQSQMIEQSLELGR